MTKICVVSWIWVVLSVGPIILLPNLSNAESRWDALNYESLSLLGPGKYEQALQVAKEALELAEKDFGPDHPNTATSLNNVATILWNLGNFTEAEPLFKRALVIREKNMDGSLPGLLDNIGRFYEAQGKYPAAELYFKRTFILKEKKYSSHAFEMTTSLNNLARIYKKQKKFSAALRLYNRELYIEKKLGGVNSILVAYVYENMADIYTARGQYPAALRTYEHALKIREKCGELNNQDGAELLEKLSGVYSKVSRGLMRRAQKIKKESTEKK